MAFYSLTITHRVLFPYHFMLVGVGLNGSTVTKVFFQVNVAFFKHEKKKGLENGINTLFLMTATEVVDRTEIGELFARKPHKGDVRTKGVGYFTASIYF